MGTLRLKNMLYAIYIYIWARGASGLLAGLRGFAEAQRVRQMNKPLP